MEDSHLESEQQFDDEVRPRVLVLPDDQAPLAHRVDIRSFFSVVEHMECAHSPWTPEFAGMEPGGKYSLVDFVHTDGARGQGAARAARHVCKVRPDSVSRPGTAPM